MRKHTKIVNPADTINEQDKEKRLSEEADILMKAHTLTNGTPEDRKVLGEIIVWQVKESILHGTLLRELIDSMKQYQLKEVCELTHTVKMGRIKVFGITYSTPLSVAILVIGFFMYMVCRKEGWF